nr:MAG TPA: hypothetical protein [Bacteriophage sp.]
MGTFINLFLCKKNKPAHGRFILSSTFAGISLPVYEHLF